MCTYLCAYPYWMTIPPPTALVDHPCFGETIRRSQAVGGQNMSKSESPRMGDTSIPLTNFDSTLTGWWFQPI